MRNRIVILFSLIFFSQGCYTQLAYREAGVRPETVMEPEAGRQSALVYEYRYWFDDYYFGGYDYGYGPWYVDLRWYDPFAIYPAYRCCGWPPYRGGWYGFWYGYGGGYGGYYSSSQPPRSPRDWQRRNDSPPLRRTVRDNLSRAATPALSATPPLRRSLERRPAEKAPAVVRETKRPDKDKDLRIGKSKKQYKPRPEKSVISRPQRRAEGKKAVQRAPRRPEKPAHEPRRKRGRS